MKIYIASDHAGLTYKSMLCEYMINQKYDIEDLGPHIQQKVDYPTYAITLVKKMEHSEGDVFGILICGSGMGMAMCANKFQHIRAAVCVLEYQAYMARLHNDANVLCLGARVIGIDIAYRLTDIFLTTPFEHGRHAKRIAMFCGSE